MNPKQLILISTMALVISLGSMMQDDKTYAHSNPCPLGKTSNMTAQDEFHLMLGVSSDEEVHDALYNGQSLADIATSNHKEVQPVIELQIAQLTEQLELRYKSGSLTQRQYEALQSELRDLVTNSVHGNPG